MSAREQMEKVRQQLAQNKKKVPEATRRETPLSKAAKANGGVLPKGDEKPKATKRVSASSYCKELLRQKKFTDEEIAAKVKDQFKEFSGTTRVVILRSCLNRDEKLTIEQIDTQPAVKQITRK